MTVHACDFCGHTPEPGGQLIVGPGVSICSDCVDMCVILQAERRLGVPHWRPARDMVAEDL